MIFVKLSNVTSDKDKMTVVPLSEHVNLAPLRPSRTGAHSAAPKKCYVQYDTGADRTIVDQRFLNEARGYYKSKGRLTNTKIVLADGSIGADDPELVELAVQLDSGQANPVEALVLPAIQELPQLTANTPQTWRHIFGNKINSGGRVDLLIGCDSAHLQPYRIPQPDCTISNLTLSQSAINNTVLISGGISNSDHCSEKSEVTVKKSFLDCHLLELDSILQSKWAVENAAPLAMSDKSSKQSYEQRVADYENQLNNEGMIFDEEKKRWVSTYIYGEDSLAKLSSNYERVSRRMTSWYKNLVKTPEISEAIKAQIADYIEKGFWVAIEDSDVTSEMKPHYLPFNFVYNDNSKSTPVRIVTDSSCKDFNGLSLNMCQKGGSKFVGDTKATLLLTRGQQKIALGDVKKFYHQFLLTGTDQSLRRLLVPKNWDNLSEGYNCYVEKMMPFGDAAAGPLAVLGRMKNCDRNIHLAPDSEKENVKLAFGPASYVDDVCVGTKWDKDIGETIKAASDVAAAGSFSFKEWIRVGDDEVVKILGYLWNAKEDTLELRLAFNVGVKLRGKYLAPALTRDNIEEEFSKPLTRRKVLALQGQFYDPLGFFLPMEMVIRHMHRQVCREQEVVDFDAAISPETQEKLKATILEAMELRGVAVPRCLVDKFKPETSSGYLVACCDGSMMGHGVVIYWRPGELDQPSTPVFVSASANCAGLDGLTIYKNELSGAEKAVVEAEYTKNVLKVVLDIKGIVYLSDSESVLVSIQHHGGKFNPFASNRLSFIRAYSDVSNWRHIPGIDNPADILTRDKACLEDVLSEKWTRGGILQRPLTEVTRVIDKSAIPHENLPGATVKLSSQELAKKLVTLKKISVSRGKLADISESDNLFVKLATCFNSWRQLVRVAARLLKWKYKVQKRDRTLYECCQEAEAKLLQLIADSLPKDGAEVGGMQVATERGIKVVETRWVSAGRKRFLPLLVPTCEFAKLIMRDYHESLAHFMSIKKVIERLKHAFFIPAARTYFEQLRKNCSICQKLNPMAIQPKMGPVPHHRLLRHRPFSHVIADIFGPYNAVGVNKRTRQKIWALLIMCQSSRAINIVGMYDYSMPATVCAISRHVCRYGQFVSWRSDSGTQLKAAGAAILQGLDQQGQPLDPLDLQDGIKSKWPSVEFDFGVPSAPWTQGSAEALIKLAKKAMKAFQVEKGERKLNLLQWETEFAKVAFLVNQRPLVSAAEPGSAICPNDVLHGYSGVPPELAAFPATSGRRTPNQTLYDFWQRFIMETNTLAPGKWKGDKIELQKGDTVLILDKPNAVGSYALGVVEELHPGADGIPRKVGLRTAKRQNSDLLWRHPRCLSKMLSAN